MVSVAPFHVELCLFVAGFLFLLYSMNTLIDCQIDIVFRCLILFIFTYLFFKRSCPMKLPAKQTRAVLHRLRILECAIRIDGPVVLRADGQWRPN